MGKTQEETRMETYHTPRQTPRQQRKPQKQHKPRLPRHPAPTVTEAVGVQPRLLNRIDHQHTQRGANAGDPIDEFDVHVGAVAGAVREGGYID